MPRKKIIPPVYEIPTREIPLSRDKLMSLLTRCEEEASFRSGLVKQDHDLLVYFKGQMDGNETLLISEHDKKRLEVMEKQSAHYSQNHEVRYMYRNQLLSRKEYHGTLTQLSKRLFLERLEVKRILAIREYLPKGTAENNHCVILGSEDILFVETMARKAREALKKGPVNHWGHFKY
jgi:hypothetical protein